jgi:NADPH2:quinone reductase
VDVRHFAFGAFAPVRATPLRLQRRQRVRGHGQVAGATGTLTALWARQLDARIIAVVGSALKADCPRAAGFDDVVICTDPAHTAAAVRGLTEGSGGVDVLYDGIGGGGFANLALGVKPGGVAVLTGFAAGQPKIPVREMAPYGINFNRPDVQT